MGAVLPANAPALSAATNAPLSLTSFALSLLLVFRTNTSYSRWAEARSIWGGVTNRSRDTLRQVRHQLPITLHAWLCIYQDKERLFGMHLSHAQCLMDMHLAVTQRDIP